MLLFNELKKVSDGIDAIIQTDDYPTKISPLQLREAVLQYPSNPGKRLRPALVLWCCGLLNGNIEMAYYAAAAAEIYHNWTLVHDDIIDNDDLRRGNPSTHINLKNYAAETFSLDTSGSKKFGVDFALLAGDLQQSWALTLLLKSTENGVSPDVTLSLCRDLAETVSRELISGEAIDVEMSYRTINNVTPEEVKEMIYLKTGALLTFCVKAGAKIALNTADNSDHRIKKLSGFASSLGIAFQLKDDWLGIFSDTDKLGKSVGSDIKASKPTTLMLMALEKLESAERELLSSYLGREKISVEDMEIIKNLVRKSGAEKITLEQIKTLHQQAENCLSDFPDSNYKKLLLELSRYLVIRKN
ncbi:MAG: polyprenyl synthetase family protein [Victivallales bacterium]|nr:polyprenyl synthetase family protein [Victivallales bacterium]MCF7889358.1 polyprenyl synthetase family protein [Victivallales bacterium]